MIISLAGFMGAGKSTLGKQLSQQLGCPFIDTDAYIEEKEGHTVREIFAEGGEEHFRELEEKYLEDILEDHISGQPETLDNNKDCTLVLSLGGGMVTRKACAELIDRFTYCIYLRADIDTVLKRLDGNVSSRPMLSGAEGAELRSTIDTLFRQREPLYLALAKKVIDVRE